VHTSKLGAEDPVLVHAPWPIPARFTMASLLDKMEFDRVKIVDSESNLNRCKNSHKMPKKDHPTMILT